MNISRQRGFLCFWAVVVVSSLMVGCFVRPSQQYETVQTQSVVLSQPSQVVYTQPQPVVVQRPTVYVRQQPIYVSAPSGVLTPVRVSVPSQVYSAYAGHHCVPGTTRICEAYCGSGVQYCNPDGYSWGSCIESY